MENFLSGGIAELEAAKQAIIDEAAKNLAADEAKSAYKAKDKELNAKKMFMSDKIDSTVKNRRGELEKEHGILIEDAKRDVKEARRKKKEALSKAVDQRVKDETADLVEENKKLKKAQKALFKASKIPGFCSGGIYYALFVPKTGFDLIRFVLAIIIAAALIPNIVCALLSWKLIFKVLIYIAIVIFFALIYFLISIWTKSGNKAAVIEEGRPHLEQRNKNKKAIRKLKRGIKKDGNEEQYGLSEYDDEIARCQSVLDEKTKARDSALAEFDAGTAAGIKKEIEDEIIPQIEQLEKEAKDLEADYNLKSKAARQAYEFLASEYVLYLSERYATCERIDDLINIIKEGKASNISEALDVAKGVTR